MRLSSTKQNTRTRLSDETVYMHNMFSLYSEKDDIPTDLFTRLMDINVPVNKQTLVLTNAGVRTCKFILRCVISSCILVIYCFSSFYNRSEESLLPLSSCLYIYCIMSASVTLILPLLSSGVFTTCQLNGEHIAYTTSRGGNTSSRVSFEGPIISHTSSTRLNPDTEHAGDVTRLRGGVSSYSEY